MPYLASQNTMGSIRLAGRQSKPPTPFGEGPEQASEALLHTNSDTHTADSPTRHPLGL
jgi:hypothetical protein